MLSGSFKWKFTRKQTWLYTEPSLLFLLRRPRKHTQQIAVERTHSPLKLTQLAKLWYAGTQSSTERRKENTKIQSSVLCSQSNCDAPPHLIELLIFLFARWRFSTAAAETAEETQGAKVAQNWKTKWWAFMTGKEILFVFQASFCVFLLIQTNQVVEWQCKKNYHLVDLQLFSEDVRPRCSNESPYLGNCWL